MLLAGMVLPELLILPLSIFHDLFPLLGLLHVRHLLVVHIHPEGTIGGQDYDLLDRFMGHDIPHAPDLNTVDVEITQPVAVEFGQFLYFLVVLQPIEVFPGHVLVAFGEGGRYAEDPADDFARFQLF